MNYQRLYTYLRRHWGLHRFLLMTGIAVIFAYFVSNNPRIYAHFLVLPSIRYVLLFGTLIMFVTCFTSYSRIFKFKAFLVGHLFFATGLVYWYINYWAFNSPDAVFSLDFISRVNYFILLRVLVTFMSFSLLIAAISPSTLQYRLTKLIALIMMLLLPAFYFVVVYNVSGPAAGSVFLSGKGYISAIYVLNLSVFVVSFLLAREENSFGGVLSALALINIILGHSIGPESAVLAKFFLFLLPFLITAGVLVYWFSCLHHRVAYDPLLKIYNRDYAHAIIEGRSNVSLGRPFSIAMIDIDRFKRVNDTYGHQVGDEVLHGTAQCIRKYTLPEGITCRYGGEEIIVFFRGHSQEAAFVICDRIRRNVRKIRYKVRKQEIAVSVSIGLAECDDPAIPIDRVVKAADEAVYHAKETGRNRVVRGQVKKRMHDPSRPTYLHMVAPHRDRRRDISRKKR